MKWEVTFKTGRSERQFVLVNAGDACAAEAKARNANPKLKDVPVISVKRVGEKMVSMAETEI